jgi:hypothetical protein
MMMLLGKFTACYFFPYLYTSTNLIVLVAAPLCRELVGYIHGSLVNNIKAELAEAEFVAVLVDETVTNASDKVALVYIYYIQCGVVNKAMLALNNLHGSGTAETISKHVQGVLTDFGVVREKVVILTTGE